jgi:hypothetical protein
MILPFIIEHVHVSRRMIADPPDENVTPHDEFGPFIDIVVSESSLSILLKFAMARALWPAREAHALPRI